MINRTGLNGRGSEGASLAGRRRTDLLRSRAWTTEYAAASLADPRAYLPVGLPPRLYSVSLSASPRSFRDSCILCPLIMAVGRPGGDDSWRKSEASVISEALTVRCLHCRRLTFTSTNLGNSGRRELRNIIAQIAQSNTALNDPGRRLPSVKTTDLFVLTPLGRILLLNGVQ